MRAPVAVAPTPTPLSVAAKSAQSTGTPQSTAAVDAAIEHSSLKNSVAGHAGDRSAETSRHFPMSKVRHKRA